MFVASRNFTKTRHMLRKCWREGGGGIVGNLLFCLGIGIIRVCKSTYILVWIVDYRKVLSS